MRKIYFIDRCLGNKIIAQSLRAAGVQVEIHSDNFAHNAEDKDWLPTVGKKRWIVLTKDSAIRRRELEKNALRDARVHAFFLASGGITGPEMASIFLKALPNIERLIKRSRKPIIAVVHRDGSVSRIALDS